VRDWDVGHGKSETRKPVPKPMMTRSVRRQKTYNTHVSVSAHHSILRQIFYLIAKARITIGRIVSIDVAIAYD